MSNGNGSGLDPKWESQLDVWIREILEKMGNNLGSKHFGEEDKQLAQVSMARALIYAGCSIIVNHTGEEPESAQEMIQDCVDSFCADM